MSERLTSALVATLAVFFTVILLTLALRVVQGCHLYGYSAVECFWRFVDP